MEPRSVTELIRQAAHNYIKVLVLEEEKMWRCKHSIVHDRVEINEQFFPNRTTKVSRGQVCRYSEVLNEACNEAQKASVSERK